MKKTYSGVIVPLVTSFLNNGKVDINALQKIVTYVTKNHCAPFVLGTTGEAASIATDEFPIIAEAMVQAADSKSLTYAGIASNNFKTSVRLARQMFDVGVDAVVAHPPSYYPLTDDNILRYYENLAEALDGPLLIYNIPATAHHSIPLQVIDSLSHHPNIVGIKDSERNENRMQKSIEMWKGRADFVHLLGWGAELSRALLLGSDGIVPSTGNLTPHLYNKMYEETLLNHSDNARELQKVTDQFSKIYQEGRLLSDSLAALKVMLSELGLCGKEVLPPLQKLPVNEEEKIVKSMQELLASIKNERFGVDVKWP